MESQIKTYTYPNGDLQRVQLVRWQDWSKLDFLPMEPTGDTLECFSNIYRNFLVPAAPWLFGNMILFRLPEDLEVPFSHDTRSYGTVAHRLTAAAAGLQEGVRFHSGNPVFRGREAETFYRELEKRDCLRLVRGRLPITTVIPLGNLPGYMTKTEPGAAMKVNAPFFIMDRFDCATVYDHVGTPLGLRVKDGIVSGPPLYNREALLVFRDGRVEVRNLDIRDLKIEINGQLFIPGKNADVYTRPARAKSPRRFSLVIVGTQVAAVCPGGAPVPASGFVLCPREEVAVKPGDTVTYRGLEDILFGIQVGNSIIRDGEKTTKFRSRFYNLRHLQPVPYPPSLYPMDFDHARAARIALGADREGKPMLLWAEGAAKFGYTPGKGSCGASLREMADICADLGMENAINLDGGGSAQILLSNRRSLMISDRKKEDFSEAERPVPMGLVIRE